MPEKFSNTYEYVFDIVNDIQYYFLDGPISVEFLNGGGIAFKTCVMKTSEK